MSDVETVISFYRTLGAAVVPDHDQGLALPTIVFADLPITFCLGPNCKTCGVDLVYGCEDLNYWRNRLAENGILGTESINDNGKCHVEYHVLPQLTVAFEQLENSSTNDTGSGRRKNGDEAINEN